MATVQGLPQLIEKMNRLGTEGVRLTGVTISAVCDMIVVDAKQNAPADLGKIRQGIVKQIVIGNNSYEGLVFATAPESAYQEFGTGGKVDVPEEMSGVASQFQGKSGGDMQAFIDSLIGWIKRHGLTNIYSITTRNVKTHAGRISHKGTDEENTQLAWAIAKKILRDGLAPQPFLYPAFVAQSQKLIPMLETALKDLLKSKQS